MSYIMMGLGWLLKLSNELVGNYGVAIIIFTILIKAILMPLTVKQQRAMIKTQKLQPLLMDLQKKYANDKEKLNQETMKLYQKYQINPMGGCLPLLIQLPILMMLYFVVRKPIVYIMGFGEDEVWRIVSAIVEWSEGSPERMAAFLSNINVDSLEALTQNAYKNFGMYEIQIARFLYENPEIMNSNWIVELNKNFTLIDFNFLGIDLSQTPDLGKFFGLFIGKAYKLTMTDVMLWIIPLLSGVSSYLTSKLSQKQSPQQPVTDKNGEEQPNPMKGMMTFMPIMSAWIAFTVPSALGLYWIISNILALGQQVVLSKIIKSDITDEQIEGEIINAKKNRKKRKK